MNDSFSIYRYIIDNTNIVDVIKNYINLQKKGQNYWGICPFHSDSNPSLSVNENKKIFKCFVCNAKGNAINFVAKFKNINDYQAIKEISNLFNIKTDHLDNYFKDYNDNFHKFEKLYEMNKQACFIYHRTLFKKENSKHLEYLLERGLTKELIKEYEIGFAESNKDNKYLYSMLTNENNMFGENRNDEYVWKPKELVDNSLAILKENGDYIDFFWNRIIFPIKDEKNNVVGFSGRSVRKDDHIKYLNTKITDIFRKENVLFNFNNFDKTQFNDIYVVEGFMDVLAFRRAGINNVVASMGTSFTNSQISLIKKYPNINTIILCFDNDNAGYIATQEFCKRIKHYDFNIYVVKPYDSECKDVDEYIKKHGKDKTVEMLNDTSTFIQYKILKEYKEELSLKDKNILVQNLVNDINNFAYNKLLIDNDLSEISKISNVSIENLKSMMTPFNKAFKIEENKEKSWKSKPIKKDIYNLDNIHEINIYSSFPELNIKSDFTVDYNAKKFQNSELDLIRIIANNSELAQIFFDNIGNLYFQKQPALLVLKSLLYYIRLSLLENIDISYEKLIQLIHFNEENEELKKQLLKLLEIYIEKNKQFPVRKHKDLMLQGINIMIEIVNGIKSLKTKEILNSNTSDYLDNLVNLEHSHQNKINFLLQEIEKYK